MKKIIAMILALAMGLLCSVALWSCGEDESDSGAGEAVRGRGWVSEAQWRAALSEDSCLKDGEPNLSIRAVESWEDGERVILFAGGKKSEGGVVTEFPKDSFFRSDYSITFEMGDAYSIYKYDAKSDTFKATAPDNSDEHHEIKFRDGVLIYHTISLNEGDEVEAWTYHYSDIGTPVIGS